MKQVLVPLAIAAVLYLVLHWIEERKDKDKKKALGAKVGLFFFVWILCMIGYYWWTTASAAGAGKTGHAGGDARGLESALLETHLIQRIHHEPVHYGAAPF